MHEAETYSTKIGKHRRRVNRALTVFRQEGAAGIPEAVHIGPPTLGFLDRYLEGDGTERAKTRSAISEVFRLLDVRSSSEIPPIIGNAERISQLRQRAHRRLERLYDIPDVEAALIRYGQIADRIISRFVGNILQEPSTSSQFEMATEILKKSDPVDLALIIFDERYSQRERFEAKRKLLLMKMVASVDQRERNSGAAEKLAKFDDFLNTHVWNTEEGIGKFDEAYLVSTHDPDTNKCAEVKIITKDQVPEGGIELKDRQMLTTMLRRTFQSGSRKIPAYQRPRMKDQEQQVIKLLINGVENPEVAVQDAIGSMVVLDSIGDARKFKACLESGAEAAETGISIEDEEDTLMHGGRKSETTPGSSSKYRDHNFHVRVDGLRIEMILHTNETYLNSNYELGTAHDEYAVLRAFDSGVVALLFPEEIYKYNEAVLRRNSINRVRRSLSLDITFGSQVQTQ